jgi:hypothetical protein
MAISARVNRRVADAEVRVANKTSTKPVKAELELMVSDSALRRVPGFGDHDNHEKAFAVVPGRAKPVPMKFVKTDANGYDHYATSVSIKPAVLEKNGIAFGVTTRVGAKTAWLQGPGENRTSASAGSLAEPRPWAEFETKTGAKVEITESSMQRTQGMGFVVDQKFHVALKDVKNFWNGAPSIKGYLELQTHVAHKSGSPDRYSSRVVEIPLTLKDGKYVGDATTGLSGSFGDSAEVIDSSKISFHDDNGKWDSDGAKNYPF